MRFKRFYFRWSILYTSIYALITPYIMEDIEKEEVDMDEMKIKLSTKFMRNIISKLISKMLYKKLGYKIDVQLNDINVEFINGETNIHADVDLKLDKEEFTKIIKSSDLD